jgi:hypothetical protein
VIWTPAVFLLPPYLARLDAPYPATVTGIVVACVLGPLMVTADRLRRRYVINRMERR